MGLYESIGAIQQSDGGRLIDWDAAANAATASTPRGKLDLDAPTEAAYREAVIEARDGVRSTVGTDVSLPDVIEVIDRHHWIEQAAATFDLMVTPAMPELDSGPVPRSINTTTAAITLGFLGRRVIGQYDPALFGDPDDSALYVVHPNVEEVATELEVDVELFRRWIMHHEVSHAAEFALAPWLRPHLEHHLEAVLSGLPERQLNREALGELNRTMTAIEGFAELLMDEALDEDVTLLRERLEARRAGMGPIQQLIEWLLGISAKRQQYKRGRTFFIAIEDAQGMDGTLAVWETPDNLPTDEELADPERWIERVDP